MVLYGRTAGISGTQLQSRNRKNTASGSHIKKHRILCYILFDLTDAELCGLMHTRSECRTRVNLNQKLLTIFRLHFLP